MAGTALVPVPDVTGNPGPSNPPQQGEHCLHAKQTGPDPSSLPQVNATDVSYFGGSFQNKGLSERAFLLSRPHGGKYTKKIYPIPQQVGSALPFKVIGSPFQQL